MAPLAMQTPMRLWDWCANSGKWLRSRRIWATHAVRPNSGNRFPYLFHTGPYRQEKSTWPKKAKCLIYLQNIGRRDWIRTNDPHHVKVVL